MQTSSTSPNSQSVGAPNNHSAAMDLFPTSTPATNWYTLGVVGGVSFGAEPVPLPSEMWWRCPADSRSLTRSGPDLTSDLFDLQPAFIPAIQSTPSISAVPSNAWGGEWPSGGSCTHVSNQIT